MYIVRLFDGQIYYHALLFTYCIYSRVHWLYKVCREWQPLDHALLYVSIVVFLLFYVFFFFLKCLFFKCIMQVSFVRRTSWPPGMVRHCTDVRHPFIYHDAPSVRNSDSTFKNIYAYLHQNYDTPFHENDRPMTHIILRTPEWRSYWRTLWRTHGKVTDQDAHMGQCFD